MKNTIQDPRAALANVPDHLRRVFLNVSALQNLRAEIERPLVVRALNAEGTRYSWNPGDFLANIMPTVDTRIPAIAAALNVLENSAEFLEAKRIVEPILRDLAELEAREAEAALQRADRQRKLDEAIAAAEERALAAARKDPAVLRAEAALV